MQAVWLREDSNKGKYGHCGKGAMERQTGLKWLADG